MRTFNWLFLFISAFICIPAFANTDIHIHGGGATVPCYSGVTHPYHLKPAHKVVITIRCPSSYPYMGAMGDYTTSSLAGCTYKILNRVYYPYTGTATCANWDIFKTQSVRVRYCCVKNFPQK